MSLRRQCVQDAQRKTVSITELCTAYGISRTTGYKWLARYDTGGVSALTDQSRRPHTSPTAIATDLMQILLATRRRHPSWAPRKLLRLARRQHPTAPWPARPTLARYLKQAGLVVPARRGRRPGHAGRPQAPMDTPNAVWTTDFKGQFRLGDGTLCYPLTIADGYSRFRLSCRALTSTQVAESRPVFVHACQEYGLPVRIRSDNGVPFATQALGRLSALSVWWIRLGILPDFIEPASHYTAAPRPYPARLPALEYPGHYEVRRVSYNGGIRWHKQWVNSSQTLGSEYVGLVEIDDGEWDVYFGPLRLGRFHERT